VSGPRRSPRADGDEPARVPFHLVSGRLETVLASFGKLCSSALPRPCPGSEGSPAHGRALEEDGARTRIG
jgi:hypothetical protein